MKLDSIVVDVALRVLPRFVECMTDRWSFLTKGKVYEILDRDAGAICIEDDNGDCRAFSGTDFREVQ